MTKKIEDNQFFHSFTDKARARLLSRTRDKTFLDGTVLFAEGDPPDWVYLLREGHVQLVKDAGGDRAVVLSTVEPGDCFGEIGVLFHSGRNTGARAKGKISVGIIPCAEVRLVLAAEPTDVTMHLAMRVLNYLRLMDEKFVTETLRKEKIQLIGELAGSIIHDFKNPLTSIKLAAHAVTSEHDDAITSRCCAIIKTQSDRMMGMAQELLDFAKGKPSLKRETVSVADLFQHFRWINEELLKTTKAKLVLSPVDAQLKVDRSRMIRVLQNLVGNALDAMAKGGEVRLEARKDNGGVELSVKDNGPGIPEAIRGRLFQPFVTHGKSNGTGLGLAIAKALVEAHGGTISLDTETGKGTTVRIRLPNG